jgi:hypothetical protein
MNNLEEFCKLELIDGIVHAKYADDVYVELPTAKAIVKERRRIANNQPHSVLVTGGPISISPEARKFALSDESNALIKAWAIITEENLLKLTFFKLLFFTQNRKHKMRFFKDSESGLNWLKNQEKEWAVLPQKNIFSKQ